MAEARCAVHEPIVPHVTSEEEYQRNIYNEWRRSLVRRFYRTRNLLYNGMWPTSIWNLAAMVIILSVTMITDIEMMRPINDRLWKVYHMMYMPKGLPLVVNAVITSCFVGFWFFLIKIYVRRYLLRGLLSYRGWMYEQPKTQSVSTIVWGLLVKLVSGYSPKLYSCQSSLARMPVPSLSDTLAKLMASLEPLYREDIEKWNQLKKDAADFEKGYGPKLQRILKLKSWWCNNYVTDWWEKYVYLSSRSPLPINSNYYVLDQEHWTPSVIQTARIASTVYNVMKFKQLRDREALKPLLIRNTIPVCMGQYEKMFSTTRIPGEECDTLLTYDSTVSKHIAVWRSGVLYKFDIFDKNGRLLTPTLIQKQLDWIIKDAEKHTETYSREERILACLTGQERAKWWKIRDQHFCRGVNRDTMDMIEKAIFCLTLETEKYETMSQRGEYLLCKNDGKLWYDKCFNLVSFPDGRMGCNSEHSYADAPIIAHLLEYNFTAEALEQCGFLKDGSLPPNPEDAKFVISTPTRNIWEITPDLKTAILEAERVCNTNSDDLDLCLRELTVYGKGFMKSCKVSPDAFIQMALQVTYFKNAGKFALTYESSMTRLYLQGRTETVRSLSTDSAAFVKAFLDKSVPKSTTIKLLRKACNRHQDAYRDAMCGLGVDRHLFALYVVSKGMGYDCEFLKEALTIPWTLSTSQQPQQQIATSPDCNLPQYKHALCPGGGFGPVSDDGYGVSYMIPGDYKVFFHVSSKKSAVEQTQLSSWISSSKRLWK
ncbi:carnitine O-palmitoyltransferase 1, liver isoform-like isoform X2 [Ostrea edulis]|uniref:carnitine O-palmitoyltransferase 1, liver isoform-like isoform X2 n=1 Tax=Ostrea edulis TaxID=37623 RepID=UPI0024AFE6E6|nr:carnitine O-palmitoyltransferase 1, liver isoform-like isoform X2 [Ostrea edulis]